MNLSQLFNRLENGLVEESADVALTQEQVEAIVAWAETLDPETATMEEVLGGLGHVLDGLIWPCGVTIGALIKALKKLL